MRIGRLLLLACTGAFFAWLMYFAGLRGPDERPSASANLQPGTNRVPGSTTSEEQAPEIQVRSESELGPDEPISQVVAPAEQFMEPAIANGDSAVASSVDGTSSYTSAGAPIESPVWVRRRNEDSSDSTNSGPSTSFDEPSGNLPELASVAAITCEFGVGRTGGVRSAPIITAEWQGGPIAFDTVDLNAGTATMRGSVGATGSLTGETEVRIATTPNGIHFSAATAAGNFVLITLFGLADSSGGYAALMSRHNERPMGLHSSVFSGTCY